MDKVLRFFGFVVVGIGIVVYLPVALLLWLSNKGLIDPDNDWEVIGLAGLATALEIVWVTGIVYLVLSLISQ